MNPAASASVYTDFSSLAKLRVKAGSDAQGSLDKVARQFESLLMHQVLKSMRQANLGKGLMDSDQSLFYRDMYDQQLSLHLSENGGIGLADVIKRQLAVQGPDGKPMARRLEDYRGSPVMRLASGKTEKSLTERPETLTAQTAKEAIDKHQRDEPVKQVQSARAPELPGLEGAAEGGTGEFVKRLWPWAVEAAGRLGLKPQALIAQAALETGWGKHAMKKPDGSASNNLFGIKADSRWNGDRVSVTTHEYEQGVAIRKKAYFRSYDSIRDSFEDYVNFLHANPRYQKALRVTDDSQRYFSALQKAGYATDPRYAEKIQRVLSGRNMAAGIEGLKNAEDTPL
ncbi:MAG: flagellar assembly peptidoglycan hydrolase FlgJ [Gammaproteobacteria bacterium]|nr:flagellar assembly peptidoglycan hydrolase FlgJ [Gammaproteobacteria bacterium]